MACFYFKQKTTYEMRISDGSSDVCFADLRHGLFVRRHRRVEPGPRIDHMLVVGERLVEARWKHRAELLIEIGDAELDRSEEHTSELQSLMRISYAVFCLKKNKEQLRKYQLHILHRDNIYSSRTKHTT